MFARRNWSELFNENLSDAQVFEMLEFALGLSDEVPDVCHFNVHPSRIRGFLSKFLARRGLCITPRDERNDPGSAAVAAATPATADAAKSIPIEVLCEYRRFLADQRLRAVER